MNVVFEPVGIGEYLENFKNNSNKNSDALYNSDDDREEERPTTTETTTKDEEKFKIGEHVEAEFYALKVRNEALEQTLTVAQKKENAMSIELEHFMREKVERDAVIERLKMEMETSCSNTIRKEEERKALLREKTKKVKKTKKAKKTSFEESLRLLEKATSALELAKTENESLRKLLKEKTLKTTTKKKTKETDKRRRRERLRTTTPLPETPPFAKQFWSYRNDERRRLHEENKVHHHPLQFSDDDDDDSYSDDDDDFYSDEDTSSEEESSSSSSSESSSSSSEEEYDEEEEEYQRDATNNTSYSSIDELLDRSVVLNSRLEALERRARNLVAIENAKPAKADRDDTTE